jgi:hypothetical protein
MMNKTVSLIIANLLAVNCGLFSATAAATAAAEPASTAAASAGPAAGAGQPMVEKQGAKNLFRQQLQNGSKSVLNCGLQYSIDLVRGAHQQTVGSQYAFQSGDEIKFRVQPNIDGYLYVFVQNSDGSKDVLFPDNNERNDIQRGFEYVIPRDGTFAFDDNPGVENVRLILSRRPINTSDINNFEQAASVPAAGTAHLTAGQFADVPSPAAADTIAHALMTTLVSTDTSRPLKVEVQLRHYKAGEAPIAAVPADASSSVRTTVASETPAVETATPPSVADTPVKDKWALVVGISKFKAPIRGLLFAAKDATDFSNFLVKEEHFAPDHVKLLTNEQATRERILSDIGNDWLPRNVKPGDLVVIYIASHGTSAADDPGQSNYVVAYDTDPFHAFATGIELQTFANTLKRHLKTDRVMIVLDTCHAGAIADTGAKSVFVMPKMDINRIFQGTGQMVLASSSADQSSFESAKLNNGLFTKFLIDGLRKYPDLKSAFNYVRTAVLREALEEFGRPQTPTLKDNEWKGSPIVLSAPPVQPRPCLP